MAIYRSLVVGIISNASVLLTPFGVNMALAQLPPEEISAIAKPMDLALVKFTSDNDYEVATLGDSDALGEGQTIHLAS